MSARLRSLLALLPIVALLAVPGAAAKTRTRTTVEPARTTALIKVHGTNGWTVQITGILPGPRFRRHPVGVFAKGPHHQEVDYQELRGSFTRGGTIMAKLPGVGHIDLRYEPTARRTVRISNPEHCTSAPTTVDSSGVFRGTIDLHGEGGFTTVSAHGARGRISTYPKQTCQVRVRSKARTKGEIEKAAGPGPIEVLYASRELAGGGLTFDATSFPSLLPGSPSRTIEFTAAYFRRHHGMSVSGTTRVEAKDAASFAISPRGGSPSEATVEPPAPFKGSAEFALESPTTASWMGDLRVPVPTLGVVDLTGPEFKSILCDGGCTATAPGSHIWVTLGGASLAE